LRLSYFEKKNKKGRGGVVTDKYSYLENSPHSALSYFERDGKALGDE
jgi:hypothetical protein